MLAVICSNQPALVGVPESWTVQLAGDDAVPVEPPRRVGAVEVAMIQERVAPRWIWNDAISVYGPLVRAGVRLDRCHDIMMTERLLLPRQGRYGEPASALAVYARLHDLPVPPDPDPDEGGAGPELPTLFGASGPATSLQVAGPDLLWAGYLDQRERMERLAPNSQGIAVEPGALRLLVAADSACALIGVEMGHLGMPWKREIHERILTDRLGARPAPGDRPARMAVLASAINEAFGFPVNPDSAVDLRAAFRRVGFDLETTRAWVIRGLDHPAVAPVLAYKELSRLFSANSWNWLDEWVRDGRFRAEYRPAGVVSGRWATSGGGALQIPKTVRSAVRADPGHILVVADAAQLEPRILVALSGDPALETLAGADDLYEALAQVGFSNDRNKAKIAMLGAMYGQTSGAVGLLLPTLRRRYPAAMEFVEQAARRGEQGKLVQSVLGRTSNPPSPAWTQLVETGAGPTATAAQESRGRQVARDRGRFTRNFVIQASAADWAAVWLSTLRQSLRRVSGAEIVFFQHDELMVHTPIEHAELVADMTSEAAELACRLVFPGGRARTPVRPVLVDNYADAK